MIEKNQKITVLVLAILAIVVPLAFYIFNNMKSKDSGDIHIVTNYNDFYTVDSCIYRFISYLNSKNEDNIKLVLSNSYKKKNSVSSLYALVPENSEFVSRKMYYEQLNKKITKFYVEGYILENDYFNDLEKYNNNKKISYFVVFLDRENNTFSIEPYDGKIFMDGVSYE